MIPDELRRRVPPTARLKAVALRLFAERGVDGVTVREIAEALGSKNHSALTYHFGSKDALVRELIVDGARAIDDRRNAWLDTREAEGGPTSVRDIMAGLVLTSVDPDPPAGGECYNRFFASLQTSNRGLFMAALGGRWNSGYQRCLEHVRRLRPDIPAPDLNRRLVFMGAAIGAILAAREAALADASRSHPMWDDTATLSDAAAALAAMIEAPN